MKQIFSEISRAMEKLGSLVFSKITLPRRAQLRAESRQRKQEEAERLDRLRNPNYYRGK